MKRLALAVFVLILTFSAFYLASAQENEVEINFFYGKTCPHCAKEAKFLENLKDKYQGIKINELALEDKENVNLLLGLYKEHEVSSELYGLVPITFIKDRYFLGFDESIGQEIEKCVSGLIENRQPCDQDSVNTASSIDLEKKVKLPIVGEIDMSKYSLPVLAIILGGLDGFNVCSLGALVLILGLVLAIKSKKKILIFGSLFIITTAIVYGILILLWYQVFAFFSVYLRAMEIAIGVLAVFGGAYFLKEFFKMKKHGAVCEIGTGKSIMAKFSVKFQQVLQKPGNTLALLGLVLLFAAIITIIEFPCSAAVPVVFAGVLAKAQLSTFSYLLHIGLFVLFYMLDEIIVFLIAFFTMTLWIASSKIVVWITLIESVILFLLGFYYLFI